MDAMRSSTDISSGVIGYIVKLVHIPVNNILSPISSSLAEDTFSTISSYSNPGAAGFGLETNGCIAQA
jgi:hypothetical protein